ncbi:DUF2637 domain-containing protein [Streptomyces sp. NPDC059761]|uniref:DUF2637 domain-containing protein n=1 Tax=Streptomyces sp. NPDC059761 TaxID=3346937 RepID=UPI0036514597
MEQERFDVLLKRTRKTGVMPASAPSDQSQNSGRNWDRIATDAAIYALALGGFYLGYETLYDLALRVGYPEEQARVVAAIADLAILAYSRKAVEEVNEGRSAWGIRLIVMIFSISSFGLQLRAAWPHPVSVGFHALPPAVWIIGHEMMLRGKLRNARKDLREEQIANGLRPAPLPIIRPIWWALDPWHTFQVWRRMKLWETSQDVAIRQLAQQRTMQNKPIPVAWQRALITLDQAPRRIQELSIPVVSPFKVLEPPTPPAAEQKRQVEPPNRFDPLGRMRLANGDEAPSDLRDTFLAALPPTPSKDSRGYRSTKDIAAYITRVEHIAGEFHIDCTGLLLAALLDVDPSRISRVCKAMREGGIEVPQLATTSS